MGTLGCCRVRDHNSTRYVYLLFYSLRTSKLWRAGISIGLGLRSSYNPESATASIVSGVLDSFSAGVLIYTGLVEVRHPFF